jgi:protoheme IX farnesyltransferase
MMLSEKGISPFDSPRFRDYWVLTKPRVCGLAVFCAFIGMLLARPVLPNPLTVISACLGIWLMAAGSFAFNCVLEAKSDAKMRRTLHRATALGRVSPFQANFFGGLLVLLGGLILWFIVNEITFYLTLATFVGYAFIYTLWLKPNTPQNIVIGGASGAMPPALGWAAITQTVGAEAWVLVLIIFLWTPPHFWALALYRRQDYIEAGLPMLPVTHGEEITKLHIFMYSIVLVASTTLPFILDMSGWFYLLSALGLGYWYSLDCYRLQKHYSEQRAKRSFKNSILYLSALFSALLLDHFIMSLWNKL